MAVMVGGNDVSGRCIHVGSFLQQPWLCGRLIVMDHAVRGGYIHCIDLGKGDQR